MRVYGLDILRTIAIVSVVMIHFGSVINVALPGFPYFHMIDGVEIFFVLSGFLIGSILIKEYEKDTFSRKEVFNFWKRRWFRTLPNYYLFLVINIILAYFAFNDNDIVEFNWKFFVFLQNFDWHFYGFFWESWSLAVEEWFYILVPLTVFFLHKLNKKNKLKKQYVFLITIILFLVLPLVYRYYVGSLGDVDRFWWDVKFKKVVTMRLDTIVYGVLGAYVKYYYSDFWNKSKYYFLILGLFFYWVNLQINADINGTFMKVFHFPFISFLVLFFVPFFDSIKTGKGILYKSITHISKISYSMYLIHMAVLIQVFNTNIKVNSITESVIYYLSLWLILIVLSSLVYKYYEKPLTKLRDIV